MSLRQAKFGDHWRHAFKRQFPTKFTKIAVRSLSGFADISIDFTGGINAIVGGNGVGKSTIVAAIDQLLAPAGRAQDNRYARKLKGSVIEGTLFADGVERVLSIRDDESGARVLTGSRFEGDYNLLDPSRLASECLRYTLTDPNFGDLLEPVTPLQLSAAQLEVASYLVGKNYTNVSIYEISEYGGLERFPYLRATSAGVTYGTEDMGRGELSLLLIFWSLYDMQKNSILILEEPETHVSPRSQDCLMNIVAKLCDETGIWAIVTTHSPTVIRRIPPPHVKLLVKDEGPATVPAAATKLDVGMILGGGVALRGVILVEDEAAKDFLFGLLERLHPDMGRQFEILVAGSASAITDALGSMPATQGWLTLIGAYDGDMRKVVDKAAVRWPVAFLPGESDPAQLLKSLAIATPSISSSLSVELGVTEDLVKIALNHVAGVGHHDYLREFAHAINLSESHVRRGFVRLWLEDAGNLPGARQLIEDVRQAAGED